MSFTAVFDEIIIHNLFIVIDPEHTVVREWCERLFQRVLEQLVDKSRNRAEGEEEFDEDTLEDVIREETDYILQNTYDDVLIVENYGWNEAIESYDDHYGITTMMEMIRRLNGTRKASDVLANHILTEHLLHHIPRRLWGEVLHYLLSIPDNQHIHFTFQH